MQDVINGVNNLKGPELVGAYNNIAPKLGKPEVKKFTDLKTGRKRVLALFEEYNNKGKTIVGKAKAVRAKVNRAPGVGSFIRSRLLHTSMTPTQIMEEVREKFPESKATTRDIAWYKCKMKHGVSRK